MSKLVSNYPAHEHIPKLPQLQIKDIKLFNILTLTIMNV